MSKYTVRFRAPIALGVFALLVACGGKNKNDTLASDTMLGRDLAMAGSDTGAQPQLHDVPSSSTTKSPSTSRSTSSSKTTSSKTSTSTGNTKQPAAGGGGTMHTIPAGRTLPLTANSEVCTNTSHVGDTWTATTTAPVVGDNGGRIPAGAVVTMKVTQLHRSENVRDKIVMAFDVESIRFGGKTYPLSGNITQVSIARVRNEPKSADVKKVIGGAAIGAIAGQIIGKNTKSTVIGAAAGAAAGAGAAAATANYEGCIRSGSAMQITLSQPLQVIASSQRYRERVHHRREA